MYRVHPTGPVEQSTSDSLWKLAYPRGCTPLDTSPERRARANVIAALSMGEFGLAKLPEKAPAAFNFVATLLRCIVLDDRVRSVRQLFRDQLTNALEAELLFEMLWPCLSSLFHWVLTLVWLFCVESFSST